jgi:hypothetical protein
MLDKPALQQPEPEPQPQPEPANSPSAEAAGTGSSTGGVPLANQVRTALTQVTLLSTLAWPAPPVCVAVSAARIATPLSHS